jgi:transposase
LKAIPQVDAAGHAVVRELVKDANHATLADYVERFARRTGQRISRARMRQLLKRLELPRKNRHFGRPSGIVPR